MNIIEDDVKDGITRWVEDHLGGTVSEIVRQERWRPSWNVTAQLPSGTLELYFRSGRGAGGETRPLRAEYDVLRLLEAEGIPVPRIYGWCEYPEAIVMAQIRDIPYAGGADNDPALHRLVEEYVCILAKVHKIDVEKAAAANFDLPTTPEAIALAYFTLADAAYQKNKCGPDPLVEFVRGWVFRNVPPHRTRTALLIGDAPQFFHDGKKITAIYDLELAHIGDPMMDLASIRVRDINEPTGGMDKLMARYSVASGEKIDWAALDFHTIVAFIATPMLMSGTLRGNHPHPAFIEYLSWDLGTSRAALEALAEVCGVSLERISDVETERTRHSEAMADLVAVAASLPAPQGLMRESPMLSLANYAKRVDEIGKAVDRYELADIEAVIGRPFDTLAEAHLALEKFVLTEGASHEPALIRLFHASVMRRLQLLRDYPAPIVNRGLGQTTRA